MIYTAESFNGRCMFFIPSHFIDIVAFKRLIAKFPCLIERKK